MSIGKKLDAVQRAQEKLEIKKALLVKEGMKSTSPQDILRAQKVLKNIEHRKESDKKSFLLDPLEFNNSFGYKDKPYTLSYSTLKAMSKAPVINAIIKTRKNQIADFAEPQSDKYSTGFTIRRKKKLGQDDYENTREDWAKIEYIQDFILNCGANNSWENDDFDTFIRKIVDDSLTYDQMTFEVVRDHLGKPYEFFATDASTFRIADSYDDDEYDGEREEVKGYHPSFVQIYQGSVVNDFYPWELCFGTRNPSTSIHNTGYGISELEELVSTVTAMLWGDEYNKRFFSQGSAPKGMLRIKGGASEKQLSAFRQEWLSMITGVQQAWKTPVVNGDEVEWVDLHKSNRDMEYANWIEYLIKLSCGVYSIDPNEIGFSINSSAGSNNMFESKNEQKLKHSKDKGLYPILKFIQRKLNKYIVSQIDPDFELVFAGLNGATMEEELEIEIKKGSNFQTVNEIRKKFNLDDIEGGDIILNPTFTQMKMTEQMGLGGEGGEEGVNPFTEGLDMDNPFLSEDMDEEDNPFLKSFKNNLKK